MPIPSNLPDLSGTAWAVAAMVAIIVVGAVAALALCLRDSTPEQRPVIIRAAAGFIRAIGEAIRFLRPRQRRPPK